MRVSDFDYHLRPSQIAQHPASTRDRSRLLVLDRKTGEIRHQFFSQIMDYLRPGDVVVMNDTGVFSARLPGRKVATGGKADLLLIRPVEEDIWEALSKGRLHPGQEILFSDGRSGRIVRCPSQGRVHIALQTKPEFWKWIDQVGRTPLPPYIKRDPGDLLQEARDRVAYQTVYAVSTGSIAAPTAGLHFTLGLLDQMRQSGIQIHTVTLQVGPGTFTPVRVTEIEKHSLEPEYFSVPVKTASAVWEARKDGRRVIAVGTTTVRVLESIAAGNGDPGPLQGHTGLMIIPGHRFQVVDALITNFHLPCSSLLMLVSALGRRERILAAYREAIEKGYRFYSFGDAMFIQ